ncbi:MAG TPA: penicillin-binding transpeptidase domain-containing protein, partial [Pyrinomonadaceae bacterium]|nr:penicillin-binding transpeptidase domain-containing protein [Pyrinomonadaceae bacterium]
RADKKSRAEKKRGKSAKASRTDKKRGASARESRAERVRNRASKRDRSSSRTARRDRNRKADRPLSRRERLAEARRRQRELAEARRRAELARLAAIARQRAADQALRDETAANIARDETTGEDLEVRRIALSALGNHAGTVVVMDPKNGRVYTIVNQEWAVRRGFKPCSTIKLVTGVAGLCEKVIDPVQTVDVSTSSYHLDLTDSLAYSNNGFFQSVGGQVGFDRIIGYAREMGLGERTGINHANEYAGRVPLYKSGYAVNRMCSHGDDFEVTPIQLATLVSAIANGGSLLVPHLPRTPQEDVKFQKQERRRVNVPPDLLRRLVPGMIGAVNYGTGKLAYDPLQTVAGKTGSCIGQGGWVGLFASYAPVADPRLAVVVVTRGSRERGRVAAGVAGFIYRALNQRFGIPANIQIANTPETLVPRPKIDPKAAAVISDEEDDAEAVEAGDAGDAGATDTLTNTQRSKVKSVLMTVPSKQPEATNGPAPSQTPEPSGLERPRRVFKDQP